MEMRLDQKQIQVIFLSEFQMDHKAAEPTHSSNNASGPETANKCSVQWWFKKFCKGGESLEDEEHSGCCRKLTTTSWELSVKLILLQVQEKLPKNSVSTILQSFGIWNKLERWKSSVSGCHMSWPQIKKNHCFEVSSSLILYNNNKPFLDWIVICDEEWILCDSWPWPAQWLDWEVPKHSPKPYLHQKMVMVTVWWSTASLIRYRFLNPGESITSEKSAQEIDEMHQKLQCLQPELVYRKGPVLHHDNAWSCILQPVVQKLNELGYEVLPHPPYSPTA